MCKAKGILASLSVLLLSTTIGYANNRGVIEYPATYGSKTHLEEIRKIELTDTATVFYMTAYERPNDWFIILKDTHLTDPQGNRYTIRGTEGVPFGELYYMNQTGHISFRLFFPPLPADVTSVDYCNGNETATDQIWGIRLTNKPYKFKLPKGFEEASINKKATLPQPIIKNGTAHLEGSIFDYRPDLGKELKLYIYSALDPNSDNRQVSIHPDGTFSADIDLCTPAQVYVTYQGGYIPPCFIAPGETTRIVIDPYASTRKISLISMPRQPLLGAPVHYAGYLASLCLEMAEKVTLKPALRTYRTEQEYISFMKDSIGTQNAEQIRDFYLSRWKAKCRQIEAAPYSPACQTLLKMQCTTDLLSCLQGVLNTMVMAHIYCNNLDREKDHDAIDKYAKSLPPLPDSYFDVLQGVSELSDPRCCYSEEYAQVMFPFAFPPKGPQALARILGTDKGFQFDLTSAYIALSQITTNAQPLNAEQFSKIAEPYRTYLKKQNDTLLAQLEAAKKSDGSYTVNTLPDSIKNEDVLPTILAKFKGHPLLVDIWATWCGPCRQANQELAPYKAQMQQQGIVFVYITGETSPLNRWKIMIPDLHGQHFRVTDAQWKYLYKALKIGGVPTYLFVDKEGHIKEQQTGYPGAETIRDKALNLTKQ